MSIFDLFFKPKTPVQSLEVVSAVPVVSLKPQDPSALRRGTWVKTPDGRIGVLTVLDTVAEVTMTDAKGQAIMVLSEDNQAVPTVMEYVLNQLVRATISEIPENRYESVEQLRNLGYGD